jgi:arylsulfatase A-like enzyme
MRALEEDLQDPPGGKLGNHLGELVGIDRSVGTLRQGLRKLGIERKTLVWYCSDNGGLDIDPDACGNLRGHKGSVFEGGVRVPGIVEWPGHIAPTIADFPASTMDIMPTIVDLLGLPDDCQFAERDGESLVALFKGDPPQRKRPIPFYFHKQMALVDDDYKLLSTNIGKDEEWKLYDLKNDPGETKDLARDYPDRFRQMKSRAHAVIASIEASALGKDYPEGEVLQPPRSEFWYSMKAYRPHLETLSKRPEYSGLEKKVPKALRAEPRNK